jgi:pimeloyl-ACP methyl ester carboxylesterase
MNPPLQLSVRLRDSGGPVADTVSLSGGQLDGNDTVLILVHGYDNNFSDALASYTTFVSDLGAKFPTYIGQIAEFYWPGDLQIRIISVLSYPNQIQPAIESAQRLSAYLWNLKGARNGPMEVSFVGHSLGCRVVLELLALWTGGMPPNIRLGTVVLMAAAVLVKHVDQGGQLRAAATLIDDELVLSSKGDPVLHWAFPLGETAAREGFFPMAVGRFGGPSQTWRASLPMFDYGKPYTHSSYWPGDESSNAVAVALGGAPPRLIATAGIVENVPAPENVVSARETPVRSLPARPVFS